MSLNLTATDYHIIEPIDSSPQVALYRAGRRTDNTPVLLKTLPAEYPSLKDITRLKQEYELTRHLGLSGLMQALGLEEAGRRPLLIFEDFGGSPLQQWLSPPGLDLAVLLDIAAQTARILGDIHQRNIIHQNLTPHHIWFNPHTRQVKITNLSLASRLAQETRPVSDPRQLEGDLAYISPEQTGRMNRIIDYRTDFYSLGVTFYHLLTGRLPFAIADPLSLVHAHIAREPIPPADLRADLPPVVSAIIMKLLAKMAEDRYQSAHGLQADLERCLAEWSATGVVAPFTLAEHDVSTRFQIPQKLYGREPELATLLAAFDRISAAADLAEGEDKMPPAGGGGGPAPAPNLAALSGQAELLLVAGYSGIGKSALVSEVYKSMARQGHRGYFIAGKFDQFQRNVPYSAVTQAFQGLVRQLLSEPEAQVQAWREKLSRALGANGQVITEFIPDIELLIGPQPPVPSLPPAETRNRFNLVFQHFIQVFTQPDHPLVIFIDDLQWADSATLSLLATVMTNSQLKYLLVIGAYRDNEVNQAHPLIITLADLTQSGVQFNRITLTHLDQTHLTQFVADTLHSPADRARPLADRVYQKTGGNPFFVIQFLKSIEREGLLAFDPSSNWWSYDLAGIEQMAMTDNVVDLMVAQIQKFPEPTRRLIRLAACIGNHFALDTLAIVGQQAAGQVAAELWPAVERGLLIPAGQTYHPAQPDRDPVEGAACKFLHDRVQQAAYSLIPADRKQAVHLQVGRLMLEHLDPAEQDEKLFDIVNHLNFGAALITDPAERERLARLNLEAGRKAKSSTAYQPALDYFKTGLTCLPQDYWSSHYDLAWTLLLDQAEAEFLTGNFAQAEQVFGQLLRHARSKLAQADVYNLKMLQFEIMAQYNEAVRAGQQGLKLFAIELPAEEAAKQAAFAAELDQIQRHLEQTRIGALIDLPVATDPDVKMSMKLLMTMWAPAYIANEHLLAALISATMVRLSLQHGHCEESAYGYVTHGITVGSLLGDYESGYEFGRLALQVNDFFKDVKLRAKIHHMFSCFVNFWRAPLKTCFPYAKEAYRCGLESGDFAYATYGTFHESWYILLSGAELSQVDQACQANITFLTQIKNFSFADAQRVIWQWSVSLQGPNGNPPPLDPGFDDQAYQTTYHNEPFFETFYYISKMHLAYMFEDFPEALRMAEHAERVVPSLNGTIWSLALSFYYALTLTALYPTAGAAEQRAYAAKLTQLRQKMKVWAENAPANFQQKYLLVAAETARINHDHRQAAAYFDRAIRLSRDNGFGQDEALACELCAKFWLMRKNERKAYPFLVDALYAYQRWGAAAKVKDLRERNQLLLTHFEHPLSTSPTPPAEAGYQDLDLLAVIKAAQALSSEMNLATLLEKLMHIVLENAGAQHGHLILKKEDRWLIEATGLVERDEITIRPGIAIEAGEKLSPAIVNYVARTGENLVLSDAAQDPRFSSDPYIVRRQPKSILCLPILRQGQAIGILYLENNLTSAAFTPARVETTQILASQAAISLENARLHEEMKQEIVERQQAEAVLRAITEGTAAVTGGNFFRSLVRHLAAALKVHCAFVTECADANMLRVRTLAYVKDGRFQENVEYELVGTPCEHVINGKTYFCPTNLEDLFPKEKGMASYVGVPIVDSSGAILGHLAVMDNEPITHNPQHPTSILQIFAARAGAELERKRAEEALNRANEALEQRVETRTAELQQANGQLTQEVNERKRMESAWQQAKEAAETANRAKSEFLARMSHELRTPLNGILGYTQILKKDKQLNYQHLERVAIIQRSGEHLLNLINDILDLAKIEASKMELHPVDFHLAEFLNNIAKICRVSAEQKGLAFIYEPRPALPPVIHGDEKRLRQILLNLLGNAVKFTDRGQITLTVEPRAGHIRFQIEDTGIGIAADNLTQIFSPFHQVGEQKYAVEGTGLGLAISQQLVQMMGGELHVSSTPGQGTTFWFELALPDADRPAPIAEKEVERAVIGFTGPRRRVLVVDDKWENRSVIVNMLAPLGFEVIEAADGSEALHQAVEFQPDLILMDLVMPVLDGFEATRRLRAMPDGEEMTIVALSASAFDDTRQKSLMTGCDGFIAKPVKTAELLATLERHLQVEWIYETNGDLPDQAGPAVSPAAPATATPEMVPPPPDEVAALLDLALQGDIKAILNRLDAIETAGEAYHPFTGRIRLLAKNFQMKQIRDFIGQYR
ncbi:MAG: AAA family ATPase [Anaerolineales bacterium]|nr:AAA family ATPase [Anaerolineales bacterium]